MNEIEIEMQKREAVYKYFTSATTSESMALVNDIYTESKERLCGLVGVIYDREASYDQIQSEANMSKEQFNIATASILNTMMLSRIKKYESHFFDGKPFDAYGIGLKSDIEIAFLDYPTALQYICKLLISIGGTPEAFDYLRMKGQMRFIIIGLGLANEVTEQLTNMMANHETSKFIQVLIRSNKLWEFFNELFKTDYITMEKALQLLADDNDKVDQNYKVCKIKIDGKEYYLYPFF